MSSEKYPPLCPDCGQRVLWAVGNNNIRVPLDPPREGYVHATIAYRSAGEARMFRALAARETPEPGETFTTSHWATCRGRATSGR